MLLLPKLTSCDVFGMLLEYRLSIEGGFIGDERVNPVGVLVSGLLSGVVADGNITRSCDVVAVPCEGSCCDSCCCDGCFCDSCCCEVGSCDGCCCDVC